MRNALHIIIGFIFWNYITFNLDLSWGDFRVWKALVVALISGVVGAVCGSCHEWLQEKLSKGSFSLTDVKITAIGFICGGLLAYAFCVPSWLFCLAISAVIFDWLRVIFKWKF